MQAHLTSCISDAGAHSEPVPAASLYALEDQLAAMLDSAELVEPEQEHQFCAEFQRALNSAVEKRDRVGQFMAHLENQIAFADQEIERLKRRKRLYDECLDRLKRYVSYVIETLGKDPKGHYRKLEGKSVTFSLVRCPASIEVRNEPVIPLAYKAVTLTIHAPTWYALLDRMEEEEKARLLKGVASSQNSIDKRGIRKAIDAGENVPGVELVTGRTWLKRS